MKWTDISNRFQKTTSTATVKKSDTTPVSSEVHGGNDSRFKKIFFPAIVIIVIIAAAAIIYWFINHRTNDATESIQLNSEEISAVEDFFEKNQPQPIQKKDITQIQNILDGTTPEQAVTPKAAPKK